MIFAHPSFSSSTNNFAHAQTLSRMSSLSGRMNIARVNIEFFTGCKKIKQRRISFVLGYLRMILWKISTAISIKYRILATFNIKEKIYSDSLYAFKWWHNSCMNQRLNHLCIWTILYNPLLQHSWHIMHFNIYKPTNESN
jgi:hypothetical protein